LNHAGKLKTAQQQLVGNVSMSKVVNVEEEKEFFRADSIPLNRNSTDSSRKEEVEVDNSSEFLNLQGAVTTPVETSREEKPKYTSA